MDSDGTEIPELNVGSNPFHSLPHAICKWHEKRGTKKEIMT